MTNFYSKEEMERHRRRAAWSGAAAWGALALGWLTCAALCFFVNTANARRMLFGVIGLATVSGWVFILLRQMDRALVSLPEADDLKNPQYGFADTESAHAEANHIAGIIAEETTEYEGVLRLSPGAFQIPRSIAVRRATLTNGEESVTLSIDAALARRLPPDGSLVRVQTVRKYITGYEVLHE